jgi:hypothetical protein
MARSTAAERSTSFASKGGAEKCAVEVLHDNFVEFVFFHVLG